MECLIEIETVLNDIHINPNIVSTTISKLDSQKASDFMVSLQRSIRNMLLNWLINLQ